MPVVLPLGTRGKTLACTDDRKEPPLQATGGKAVSLARTHFRLKWTTVVYEPLHYYYMHPLVQNRIIPNRLPLSYRTANAEEKPFNCTRCKAAFATSESVTYPTVMRSSGFPVMGSERRFPKALTYLNLPSVELQLRSALI